MNKKSGFVSPLSESVQESVDAVLKNYKRGNHTSEPEITSGICQEICSHVSTRSLTTTVEAKTFDSDGPKNDESIIGADMAIRFKADFRDFEEEKGILVQAKRRESSSFPNLDKLEEQCDNMLNVSSASYVFIYSEEHLTALPAISVAASEELSGDYRGEFHYKGTKTFFSEFFNCFLGDRELFEGFRDVKSMIEEYEIRHGIDIVVGDYQ